MFLRCTTLISALMVAFSMNASLVFAGTLAGASEANPPVGGVSKLTKEMVLINRQRMQESIFDAIGRWNAQTALNTMPTGQSPVQYIQAQVELAP